MLTRGIPNFGIRLKVKLLRVAAVVALFGLLIPSLALAQAKPTPPPWNPGGGTVDPKDVNLWHNPKDGPSDYVWDPKICRWVYKAAGKDAVGNHKAGEVATQGPPQGVPPGSGKMTGPGTAKDGSGNTYTWDDDTKDAKGVVTPGKGWVDDKTGKSLCTPPKAAAAAPGANPGPAPKTVPSDVAPEHTSVTPPPSTAVPASIPPRPIGGPFYNRPYNTPFYNRPYNTPYYNSPLEELFDFYNTPYNTPFEHPPQEFWTSNGWFFGLKTGPVWLPTTTVTQRFFDGGDGKFDLHYGTGYDIGVRGGEQIGPWRFEGEFNLRYNSIVRTSVADDSQPAGGHTMALIGMADAIYDFHPRAFGPVSPHLGAGIGLAHLSTEIKVGGTMPLLNANDTEFAYQGIAGLGFKLNSNSSLNVDYRYLGTIDASYRDAFGSKYTIGYNSHTLLLNWTYRFGVPAPKPGSVPELTYPAPPPPPSRFGPLPPTPKSELPQARQVAALVPVNAAAAHRFTLRYDGERGVLSATSVRALHEALDAIEAGQDVRIAIEGCEADADLRTDSRCAHRALRIKHLLARYGVANPDQLFAGG